MKRESLLILLLWGAVVALWAMAVWGGWAERHYEKVGNDSRSWFWLRRLTVATTKENCIRLSKAVSLVGMALLTLGVVLTLLFGR